MNPHIGIIKGLRADLSQTDDFKARQAIRDKITQAVSEKVKSFQQSARDDDDNFILQG